MNLHHIHYALEVERTGSITQAAENLYMNQPNLSKAIRELEEQVGYKIFNRTPKGITPTTKGEIFLLRGKKILQEVQDLKDLFPPEESPSGLSVRVPKYFPLSQILTKLVKHPDYHRLSSWEVLERDADETIQQVLEWQSNLGILRYPSMHDLYVRQHLKSKGLESRLLAHNGRHLIFSDKSPLAEPALNQKNCAQKQTEIQLQLEPPRFLPDDPSLGEKRKKDGEHQGASFWFGDLSTALEIINQDSATYLVSPSPFSTGILKRYHLLQSSHWDDSIRYMNRLIYHRSHNFSEIEKTFLDQILKTFEENGATLLNETPSSK
jgi:DNA-binding transcriptional LysR family regulator